MKTETLSIGGLERAVRVYDWCRDREASVIAEEIDLRLRYGRGGRDGPADSCASEMLLFRRSDRWRCGRSGIGDDGPRIVPGGRIYDEDIISRIGEGHDTVRALASAIGCSIPGIRSRVTKLERAGVIVPFGFGAKGGGGYAPRKWMVKP